MRDPLAKAGYEKTRRWFAACLFAKKIVSLNRTGSTTEAVPLAHLQHRIRTQESGNGTLRTLRE
jgi:hypothetical protein